MERAIRSGRNASGGAIFCRAAAEGISVEEAHRRVLRRALTGDQPGPQENFIAYLRSIPTGVAIAFPRAKDRPRRNEF